jgi:hypothetical protein
VRIDLPLSGVIAVIRLPDHCLREARDPLAMHESGDRATPAP